MKRILLFSLVILLGSAPLFSQREMVWNPQDVVPLQREKSAKVDTSEINYIPKRLGHYSAEDWAVVIDSTIGAFMKEHHMAGCAAIMIKEGKVVYEQYFGYANMATKQFVDHNSIFYLASISKTVTATALMQQQEKGLFHLGDSIDSHLPFKVRNPNHPTTPITFEQLLTHTSSIQDNWSKLKILKGDPPIALGTYLNAYLVPDEENYETLNYTTSTPGIKFQYSNVGLSLCGYLNERITGMPFHQYCTDSIFDPLGMTNTSWFLSGLNESLIAHPYTYKNGDFVDHGLYYISTYPAGNLRSTAVSLSKFMQMQIDHGQFDKVRILDSTTVENNHTARLSAWENEWQIGLSFLSTYFGDIEVWGHDGGMTNGAQTDMWYNRATKTGVIILTNGVTNPVVYFHEFIKPMFDYAEHLPPNFGMNLNREFVTSIPQIPPEKVSSPFPLNMESNADNTPVLKWNSDRFTKSFSIYLSTDSLIDSLDLLQTSTENSILSGGLERSSTYYWRVDAVNQNGITKGDVWSFTTHGDNLALNKPVIASSEYDSVRYKPAFAVDGDNSSPYSRWWPDIGKDYPHWLEVDLESVYEISAFKIYSFYGNNSSLIDFKVQYLSGEDWLDAVEIKDNVETDLFVSTSCFKARKVRLWITKALNDRVRLYGFEVYGELDSASVAVKPVKVPDKRYSIYPNPATNMLHIKGMVRQEMVCIYNLVGQKVIKTKCKDQLDISELRNGVYLIQFENGATLKFTKLE